MSTKSLTMVQKNNELVVAQYGRWDGHPSGQGAVVLEFAKKISNKLNLSRFEKQLKKCVYITETESRKLLKSFFGSSYRYDSFITLDKSNKFKAVFPTLHPNTSADVLNAIYYSKDKKIYLIDSSYFAGESLFCEWAYLINLDTNQLEVYRGFNKEPLEKSERFYSMGWSNDKYYPIKLLHTYDISNLPEEKDFVKQLEAKANKMYERQNKINKKSGNKILY
jgi:hypothetical protein